MVPAGDVVDVEDDTDALGGLSLEERQRRLAEHGRAVVLHADRLADLEDLVVVVDDHTMAAQLDAAELVVGVAALDQAGHLLITTQVEDLLALAERPEHGIAVDHRVPHRHHVRMAGGADRCHVEHAFGFEIGLHLLVGHHDLRTLAGHGATVPWAVT